MRAVALAAVALLTCCHPCNDDVCEDFLTVTLGEPGGGPLQAGQYVFALVVDGAAVSATCDIGPGGSTATCTKPASGLLYTPLHDSADNPHEDFNIQWQAEVPEALTIRIEHDGVVVFDETVDPGYEQVDEVCYGDCRRSSKSLALDRG